MVVDAFGRAIHDRHRGTKTDRLVQRDGPDSREHTVEHYLEDITEGTKWLDTRLDGPILDMGAGAGRHALYFQEQFETVAIETSEPLVETMQERGVADARQVDMFSLSDVFGRDRFRSAFSAGTQVGLAGSLPGLRQFLCDLAVVTTPDAIATFELYDPEWKDNSELIGYRADPAPGFASRVMHFEYEETVGRTLLFRLFSPDRLREATVGTDWEISEIDQRESNISPYRAVLQKSS